MCLLLCVMLLSPVCHCSDKKPDDETKFDSLTESSEGNSTINLKETTPLEQSTPPLVPGHVLVTDGGGGR